MEEYEMREENGRASESNRDEQIVCTIINKYVCERIKERKPEHFDVTEYVHNRPSTAVMRARKKECRDRSSVRDEMRMHE